MRARLRSPMYPHSGFTYPESPDRRRADRRFAYVVVGALIIGIAVMVVVLS